jgi:hypothetical protein
VSASTGPLTRDWSPPYPVDAQIPSWEWHRAGVEPRRAAAIAGAARAAGRLEEIAAMAVGDADRRLRALPGVGPWTSAEVRQRACGDADAVSVGDCNLPAAVGWALAGRIVDDAGMLDLLAPYAGHRYRATRLVQLSGVRPPRRGAGNRTSGPVLRSGSPQLVIQEAWAWLTATQLVRASEAAVLRSEHAAARALRRRTRQEVTADEESFTAGVRHAIRSMASTQVTATLSLEALAAAADSAARACLHTLNLPGRQRHSERAQKARPKFPHASATKQTVTGKPQVTVFAPGFY